MDKTYKEILMKRLFSILLIVGCLLGVCACSASSKVDDSTVGKIVYGEKYISDFNRPKEQQDYYIVYEDYLEFHYYDDNEYIDSGERGVSHYKMKCKYTIVDESTLAYFHDSVKCYDDCEIKNHSTASSGILIFSENVLMTKEMRKFVRESYYENELTNFCKTEED